MGTVKHTLFKTPEKVKLLAYIHVSSTCKIRCRCLGLQPRISCTWHRNGTALCFEIYFQMPSQKQLWLLDVGKLGHSCSDSYSRHQNKRQQSSLTQTTRDWISQKVTLVLYYSYHNNIYIFHNYIQLHVQLMTINLNSKATWRRTGVIYYYIFTHYLLSCALHFISQ